MKSFDVLFSYQLYNQQVNAFLKGGKRVQVKTVKRYIKKQWNRVMQETGNYRLLGSNSTIKIVYYTENDKVSTLHFLHI